MPCVGNDVVDLKDASNAGKSGDSRFLKKILTDAEIEYVKNADNPDLALWSLWACKETAYKVMKKNFSGTAFIPRRWQILLTKAHSDYSEGEVQISEKVGVHIRLFSSSHYIHCVGSDSLDALDKLIRNVETLPKEETNPSLFSRHCLAQSLANHFSLDLHQIKIKRNRQDGELQPPQVCVDGKKTNIDVSLSHDGRFVACAFLKK